ncbi:MAG TPA: hypothetical protein VNJ08_11090 [Bacteriovoracaceae bacterium]|nr:hypothetical protein [Bacteriovoracaceae bacterium]
MKPTETPNAYGNADQTAVDLGHSFDEISNTVAETAAALSEKGMSMMKKYPLHTALVAGGIGFVVGAMIARK